MIYITGDKHGDYRDVFDFCYKYKTDINDILIVLGDAGINYHLDEFDYILKNKLRELPINLFCIHVVPGNISVVDKTEKVKKFRLVDEAKDIGQAICSAQDGEIYDFNNLKTLVIGGAYSIDKNYRILMGYNWYPSEQPSDEIKKRVRDVLREVNNKVDVIVSHTCPFKYLPYEAFISGVDQTKVDKSTEEFLDEIENNTKYTTWYCGHYHIDKRIDKIRFMMNDIDEFR